MATSPRHQEEDMQKAQGQGRVAAGGYDDAGHPLTKDGHVDHRTERSSQDDDDRLHRGSQSSHKQETAQRGESHASSSQGHVAAGGFDDEGHPLTRDGHVDRRTKAGRDEE